jgi:hypothetical protein
LAYTIHGATTVPAALPILLGVGLSVDIADVIATSLAFRHGVRSPLALFMCGGGAAVFAVLGAYGLQLYNNAPHAAVTTIAATASL